MTTPTEDDAGRDSDSGNANWGTARHDWNRRASPAPTGAGEAEKLADDRKTVAVFLWRTVSEWIGKPDDPSEQIAAESEGWLERADKLLAALRRAQPPQPSGAQPVAWRQRLKHSCLPWKYFSEQPLGGDNVDLEPLCVQPPAQPTGDAEGLGFTTKELCELLGKHAGCFMPCACHEVGPPHGAGGQGPCRAVADEILRRFNSRTTKSSADYDHAARLLKAIWPQGRPLNTTSGVIDQIDNWIVGLKARVAELERALDGILSADTIQNIVGWYPEMERARAALSPTEQGERTNGR